MATTKPKKQRADGNQFCAIPEPLYSGSGKYSLTQTINTAIRRIVMRYSTYSVFLVGRFSVGKAPDCGLCVFREDFSEIVNANSKQ